MLGKPGNISVEDQEARRDRVREAWARGIRSLNEIARIAGCSRYCVKKDLWVIRRRVCMDPLTEQKLFLLRESIAAGYQSDIQELTMLIDKVKAEKPQATEVIADGGIDGDQFKQTGVKRLKRTTRGTDYHVLGLLIKCRLEARRKMGELYHLLEPENRKLLIDANFTTSIKAEVDVNVREIPDGELITAAKSVFGRIASTN